VIGAEGHFEDQLLGSVVASRQWHQLGIESWCKGKRGPHLEHFSPSWLESKWKHVHAGTTILSSSRDNACVDAG